MRILALVAAALLLAGACAAPGASERRDVLLATTTTVQDSGVLDAIRADFEKATGYRLRATAQGTGATLKIASSGQADVVLVHEPVQEREFMAAGYGRRRELVMYNDFVLVGPPSDGARVRGRPLEDALRAIAAARATFISRGDRSGTDVAEKASWARAGLSPSAPWYVEAAVGQGQALRVASERKAYMLVDTGTFTAQRADLALEVLVRPEPRLLNLYHVMTVDPARFPNVNAPGAGAFVDRLLSAEGQRAIGAFGSDRYGAPLFVPAAGRDERSLP